MKQIITKCIVLTIGCCLPCFANTVWISDVTITPEPPIELSKITIDVSGQASNGGASVVGNMFTQNGTSLQIDLQIDMGITAVISEWGYSIDIPSLPADSYTLTVTANGSGYFGGDTRSVNFTVVPEPATLLLLGIGAMVIRKNRRKR